MFIWVKQKQTLATIKQQQGRKASRTADTTLPALRKRRMFSVLNPQAKSQRREKNRVHHSNAFMRELLPNLGCNLRGENSQGSPPPPLT